MPWPSISVFAAIWSDRSSSNVRTTVVFVAAWAERVRIAGVKVASAAATTATPEISCFLNSPALSHSARPKPTQRHQRGTGVFVRFPSNSARGLCGPRRKATGDAGVMRGLRHRRLQRGHETTRWETDMAAKGKTQLLITFVATPD